MPDEDDAVPPGAQAALQALVVSDVGPPLADQSAHAGDGLGVSRHGDAWFPVADLLEAMPRARVSERSRNRRSPRPGRCGATSAELLADAGFAIAESS